MDWRIKLIVVPTLKLMVAGVYPPATTEKIVAALFVMVAKVPVLNVNIRQDCVALEVARKPTWPVPTLRQDPVEVEDKEEMPPPK